MKFEAKKLKVKNLAEAFTAGSLISNSEYQRGKTWEPVQMQVFIDSLYRGYPVPTIFLYKIVSKGLEGEESTKFEIVDGQQRIRSIVEYRSGDFALLNTTDRKFRIPESLRAPTKWSGRYYTDLPDDELRNHFDEIELEVQMISEVASPDEIRDLFIRLQSGTALTRQQVRDAWPGNIGPFIERIAGKMKKQPTCELFGLIDGRGNKTPDDDGDDPFSNDRATAAQLLTLFLARERSDSNFVGISAPSLDALYHAQSAFDGHGDQAKLFEAVLSFTATILKFSTIAAVAGLTPSEERKKRKYPKLTVLALFCWGHDFQVAKRNGRTKISERGLRILASYVQEFKPKHAKGQTGPKIREVFEQFISGVPAECMIDLDPKREFNDEDKLQIRTACEGRCSRCGEIVLDGDAAYHHKEPWARGGRTTVENGTLLHERCHQIIHSDDPVQSKGSY